MTIIPTAPVLLPSPPENYDPKEQRELRRILMDALKRGVQDTIPLTIRARITATSASTVTVRVAVADPFPQGTNSAQIAYSYVISTGAGTVDVASPQNVTPEATITEAAGTYVDFVVTRPPMNTGTGRITFTAGASERLQATDAVDIPAVDTTGTIYSQCLAQITASDDETITVTVTANALTGTPTVHLVAITGTATLNSGAAVGATGQASGSVWVFNRGPALGGVGQAQFRATFAGTQTDDDFVVIPETPQDTVYSECKAAITAADATTITVTVTATATTGTPTVHLVAITGSATLNSGAAIGATGQASGSVWVFNRGAALGGNGQVQFRATLAGTQTDDDFVEIPEVGRDTVPLTMRARVTDSDSDTVTVRVAVADPFPQGAASVSIAYVYQIPTGAGTVDVASPQTVTPAATLTEAAGTYVDFVVTRPDFGGGGGRITFTATAADRVHDVDAVDIPEKVPTVFLSTRARVTSSNATTVVVRVAVADPYPQGANSATISYTELGVTGTTPSSGGTVTPAATITEAAGTYVDYTITRPAFANGTGRVTFTATAANRIADSDSVDIPAQERTSFGPTLSLKVTTTATNYEIVVTYTGTMTYKINGGTDNNGTGSPQTINVTRNPLMGKAIVYVFKCVADGQTLTETVVVLPEDPEDSPVSLSIGTCTASDNGGTPPPYNRLVITWSSSGMPTGTTYDVSFNNGVADGQDSATGQTGTSKTFNSVTFGGTPGRGIVTITAKKNGATIATVSERVNYVT